LSEEIGVVIDGQFCEAVDEKCVAQLVLRILAAEGVAKPYEVSLMFTDSEIVQRLNRDYRGLDEITDVLAFPLLSQRESDLPFTLPPDGVTHLGEVIISCPQASEQAGQQGHSFDRELAVLIIHGMLHLLGYDHEEPDEERKMKEKETNLLERCFPGYRDR
jgi:probable rRNA maturation factor